LSFFTHRQKTGDLTRLSEETGYSVSHLSNITSLRRKVTNEIANAMYMLTRRRAKNSEYAQA
jgi:hypothetical protein